MKEVKNTKVKILIGVLFAGIFLIVIFTYLNKLASVPPASESSNTSTSSNNNALSDEELLKYAKSSFDKGKMMGKDFILGYHNGIPVRVSFPCSDICPQYTIRVIRYDINLGDCESVGGVIKSIYVPFAIAVKAEAFCFPKIIVENNIYQFVPNVVIVTDKSEYKEGEEIKLTVINNFDRTIYYRDWSKSWKECGGSSFKLGRKENGSYKFFEIGLAKCLKPIVSLQPKSKAEYTLNPKELEDIPSAKLKEGIYKWGFTFGFEKDLKFAEKIYSNEFLVEAKEVTITTDKTEYRENETIKVTIKNNLNQSIWYYSYSPIKRIPILYSCFHNSQYALKLQRYEELISRWKDIPVNHGCCFAHCRILPPELRELKPGKEIYNEWDQKVFSSEAGINGELAKPGRYRFVFVYHLSNETNGKKYAYSNEFEIK